MEKDVICKSFDDQLDAMNDMIGNLRSKFNYYMKRDDSLKKSKSSSLFTTITCALIGIATLIVGNNFFASRDIAAFIFYAATAVSGVVSIGGAYMTINTLREIRINNRRIKEVQKQLMTTQKKKNQIMQKYNAHKIELERNFGEKIKRTDDELTNELMRMVNGNNVITEIESGRKKRY
ncbi:MAG: hypothetical protein ACI4VL_04435 [Bacilli bacterium]